MAKEKNGNKIKVLIWLAGIVFFAGVTWAAVGYNALGITDHETRMRTVEESMIEQRTDIGHIKDSLERIESKLDK